MSLGQAGSPYELWPRPFDILADSVELNKYNNLETIIINSQIRLNMQKPHLKTLKH